MLIICLPRKAIRLLLATIVAALAPLTLQLARSQTLPDAVRLTGVTVSDWKVVQEKVKRAAAARGTSEKALAAVAQRLGSAYVEKGKIDINEILSLIDQRAQELVELQNKLRALELTDDPAVAKLLVDARRAIDAGDLKTADQLLARATESDLAAIAQAEAETEKRRVRAAEMISKRGDLASLEADYREAAKFYERAAKILPNAERGKRWLYTILWADALYRRGEEFLDDAALKDSGIVYETVAMPLAVEADSPAIKGVTLTKWGNTLIVLGQRGDMGSLEKAADCFRRAIKIFDKKAFPSDWVIAQTNLANALQIKGKLGDRVALRDAITIYEEVLDARPRETDLNAWADTKLNIGAALRLEGTYGNSKSLWAAIQAYQDALTVWSKDTHPQQWAEVQSNLGIAWLTLGERGDPQALRQGLTGLIAASEVFTKENAPFAWAQTRLNIGSAMLALAKDGDKEALQRSVTATRDALSLFTRASAPALWADAQTNLGAALSRLGDKSSLARAVEAYQAALQVRTRSASPAQWASTSYNLARALAELADLGDANAKLQALDAARNALSGYEQVGNLYWAPKAAALIKELESPRE